MEEKYNDLANYVLFGEEKTNDLRIGSTIQLLVPYFEGLQENELADYLTKATNKYVSFADSYTQSNSENRVNVVPMKMYFVDYAGMQPLDLEEVVAMYVEGGQAETRIEINNKYRDVSDGDERFRKYVAASRELAETYLGIVANADKAGCVKQDNMLQGCYSASDAEKEGVEAKVKAVAVATEALKKVAMDAMIAVGAELDESEGANG